MMNDHVDLKVLKQDERQKITMIADQKDGKVFIKRELYSDKRELYKTLQKIQHPNIPKIFSVEFADSTIIIEEYINGQSLQTWIEQSRTLTKKHLTSIAMQLVSAMEALHKAKIIHRDIKPDNIYMNEAGHIWLMDFDISRIYREEIRKDTEILGTVGYAPPEQFGIMPTDDKTDIYAFGVTMLQLLDCANKKGALYKIAKKCKRLDPAQRYNNAHQLKKAIQWRLFKLPVILCVIITAAVILVCAALIGSYMYKQQISQETNISETEGYVEVDEETAKLLKFKDFKMSDTYLEYTGYENFSSTFIFNVEERWAHLLFLEDMKNTGIITLGKGGNTEINAELELKDGVFSVSLRDPYGHSFAKDFSYTPNHTYTAQYTENRRQNAEIICWDMNGDYIDELLIGVNDGSFAVDNKRIFNYFNYSQGWILKYDEARGFTLCEGDMFSENSKFSLEKDDLRIHLPVFAATDDGKLGYELESDTVVPFY